VNTSVLRFADGDLTLRVPSERAAAVGMRQIVSPDESEDVLEVFRRREVRVPANWSRRFKNHTDMLRSGDVYQLAEVVRNLSRRNSDRALSVGEQRMLQIARRNLISELSLALAEDPDTVGLRMDAALA
jgi:CarD family transcriptional regulator